MLLAPAQLKVTPSQTLPGLLLPYQQLSGFERALAGGSLKVMLDEYDKFAYVHKMDVRTKAAIGRNASNQLPSIDIELELGQTPTYLLQVQAAWNRRDIGHATHWNVDLRQAQVYGGRQGIYQQIRNLALYGTNPSTGEGLLNTIGATVINSIPADPYGNTTVSTVDNGWMQQTLNTLIQQLKVRTMQMGRKSRITILGPQRILAYWEAQIVQLTQYQRAGAGSGTIKKVVDEVAEFNGDEIEWVYDDTLIGKMATGYDAVIIALPEVEKPSGYTIDTNEFAKVNPGLAETIIQLCDKTAPSEYTMALALDSTSLMMEMLVTSGWVLRPECLTILGAQYQ